MLLKLAILFALGCVAQGFFGWKNCAKQPETTSSPSQKVIKAHGCENKSDVMLTCPSGSVIAITKAFFGHGYGYNSTCDDDLFWQRCKTNGVLDKVKYLCQNRPICRIEPTEKYLGQTSCIFGLEADLHIEYVCNPASVHDTISIRSMHLDPSPLALPGPVNASMSVLIKRNLPSTTKLKLDVEKKILGAAWMSIPCISNFGSCTYENFCDLMRKVMFSKCDAEMQTKGIPCDCPIPTGLFTFPNVSIIATQEMVEQIPVWDWLVNGRYRVTAEFLDVYNHVIGCVQVQVEVDIDSKKRKKRSLKRKFSKFVIE